MDRMESPLHTCFRNFDIARAQRPKQHCIRLRNGPLLKHDTLSHTKNPRRPSCLKPDATSLKLPLFWQFEIAELQIDVLSQAIQIRNDSALIRYQDSFGHLRKKIPTSSVIALASALTQQAPAIGVPSAPYEHPRRPRLLATARRPLSTARCLHVLEGGVEVHGGVVVLRVHAVGPDVQSVGIWVRLCGEI